MHDEGLTLHVADGVENKITTTGQDLDTFFRKSVDTYLSGIGESGGESLDAKAFDTFFNTNLAGKLETAHQTQSRSTGSSVQLITEVIKRTKRADGQ